MKFFLIVILIGALSVVKAQRKGIDYLGHDVGLINKHGWVYADQGSYLSYLTTYYFSVAGVLSDKYKDRVAYIEANSSVVKSNKVEIVTVGASDHVLNITQHRRPAIYRKWSNGSGEGK